MPRRVVKDDAMGRVVEKGRSGLFVEQNTGMRAQASAHRL